MKSHSSQVQLPYRYSYRNIWEITYPILISLVMEQLLGMTDTAFLGRVGEIELGASAIASIFYSVLFMLGFGFSIGAQIIIGRRNGETVASGSGDFSSTGRIFWQGTWFLLGLAVVVIIASETLSGTILRAVINSDLVYSAALTYVLWRAPSFLFAYLGAMFKAFYTGTTKTKALTFNAALLVGSNILLDWVLIFGKFGLPAMGIKGAAIASTIASAISLGHFIICAVWFTPKRYGLGNVVRPFWSEIRSILSTAAWVMVEYVLSVGTWLFFFILIEHLGEKQLAIANIVRSISGMLYVIMAAFAATCSTLVSNIIGEGHPEGVRTVIGRVLAISYAFIMPVVAVFCIFPESVIGIFTNIPELISESVPTLWVMCVGTLLTVPSNTYLQAVVGTGNTRTSFRLDVYSLIIYIVYCLIVVGTLKANVAISWTADWVYGLGLWLFCGLYIRSGKWVGRKV